MHRSIRIIALGDYIVGGDMRWTTGRNHYPSDCLSCKAYHIKRCTVEEILNPNALVSVDPDACERGESRWAKDASPLDE